MSAALVTLAVGTKGREIFELSRPFIAAWAKRLGADFIVIDDAPANYSMAGKFHLSKIVPEYDRTIFVDADIIPSAEIPDPFAMVPAGSVGMHDDLPHIKTRSWADRLFEILSESQGWIWTPPTRRIWNTGLIVAARAHAPLFAPPDREFPAYHCSEQFLIQLACERAAVPIHQLQAAYNYQWWFERRMPTPTERPDIFIRHFAGASQQEFKMCHERRLRLMRAVAAQIELRH